MIGDNGENLIFLISQPRSGSTLLQLMLSGSPEIATSSEPWIALHPIFALKKSGLDSVYGTNLAREALIDFLDRNGMNIDYYKKQISFLLSSLYNQALIHHKKQYFLDKTPRYYHITEELLELFPKAKFIVLFRNPLAVLNSILKTWVKDDLSFLYYYIEDLILAPKKLIHCVQKNLDRIFKVNYEKLVVQPEKILMDISRFLGIEYSENMINYGKRPNPGWRLGDQISVFQSTRPAIDSMNKWKDEFRTPQTVQFASSYLEALGPTLINEMGYDYDDIKSSISSPANHSTNCIVSWATIMNVMEVFSNTIDVRRVVLDTLSKKRVISGIQDSQNLEWNYPIKKMISNIMYPKINELTEEINKYKRQRDAMLDTLSWRITAPVRNCKILKKIVNYLKNHNK